MILSVIGLFEDYKEFFSFTSSYKATYELLMFNNGFKFFMIIYFI